jgi:hypothetical protein
MTRLYVDVAIDSTLGKAQNSVDDEISLQEQGAPRLSPRELRTLPGAPAARGT